ncbi:mediator of RNA polymerase II transcription subunit 14 [Aspergillus avenaceus]|uniref:Mediator of RNA polymerase II transcription subunit 14 n=1 Tax=Aspergillus avenaceus TaxID=36643 RepID=A0A5N6TIQ7_ASPAV|nr:mediator of RNA polymerase II transcription subunit 14 [Aspergillus avenaceus]
MPGIIMDHPTVGGAGQGSSVAEPTSNMASSAVNNNRHPASGDPQSRFHVNGMVRSASALDQVDNTITSSGIEKPPQLSHITQGFFPFSMLINRSVQQCWNDLSDLIADMAEIHVQSQEPISTNGKSLGNQSPENLRKKLRVLEFAHAKRAEFIKLLVLSQWSRHAADVSKLIDLQNFIRTRHQAYMGALQWVGDMKRDLVQAQVANPDLKTALEVLSNGKVMSMSDLGYKLPKPLTGKNTLKKLQKINRVISARLVLHDLIPRPFQTYHIHDGRVTFVVPSEFELDLSVGQKNESSQLYFVDIRFLFTPSSPIPRSRIFNELDMKINDTLRDAGLTGCFDLLHSLVLTNKINILFKQALELARSLWSDVLRIELLHRTLVVHYWAQRPGAKSWIEIGIKSGRRKHESDNDRSSYLGLRWVRDGEEIDTRDIVFNTECLSMECILRSAIALHISHILSSAYANITRYSLYSTGKLSLRAQLTRAEPGDCRLDMQLTGSRYLRVSIEPMSGASIISATPSIHERPDNDRSSDRPAVEDITARVSRHRCIAAIEEIESSVKMLGFETVNPRSLRLDLRKIFPNSVLRFSFFWHRNWERSWVVAATSSMDGDNWWVVQLQPAMLPIGRTALKTNINNPTTAISVQNVSTSFFHGTQQAGYPSFADLGRCLAGILSVHANARYLADLQSVGYYPPLNDLMIESGLRVPDIFLRYETGNIPQALRIGSPGGITRKTRIKDTIRLSFHGIDPGKEAAIMVAYGNLSIPTKPFSALIPRSNRSLVFQKQGSGFAIRLLAAAGRPVISELVEYLQRLDSVLYIIEILQRRKMEPRSLSLSHVTFAYGPEKDLIATIDIKTTMLADAAGFGCTDSVSSTESPCRLRFGITFDALNPHRRIQESLKSSLNGSATDTGLDAVAEVLSLTLPLMRALDHILINLSYKEPLRVQIIVRNAKTYQIHYPAQNLHFQLVACHHLSHTVWVLRDLNNIREKLKQDQLELRLQDRIYMSKGDGWKGLGNGAVAEVDKVGNLLAELHGCLNTGTALGREAANFEASANSLNQSNQQYTSVNGLTGAALGRPTPLVAANNTSASREGGTAKSADIIMID